MANYYLVDYENVREGGLRGAEKLGVEDSILLFYTKNANKISLDSLRDIRASIRILKAPAGKQSLDMHIASMLGYLVGKTEERGNYIIVSKDNDFDTIITSWNEAGEGAFLKRPSVADGLPGRIAAPASVVAAASASDGEADKAAPTASEEKNADRSIAPPRPDGAGGRQAGNARRQMRRPAFPVQNAKAAPDVRPEAGRIDQTPAPDAGKTVPEPSADVNTEKTDDLKMDVAEPRATAGVDGDAQVPAAETADSAAESAGETDAVEASDETPGTETVENPAEPSGNVQKKGNRGKNQRKRTGGTKNTQPSSSERPVTDSKTDMNNRIVRMMRDSGAEGIIPTTVASVVMGFVGKEHSKQGIYRAMIKKFGQKTGLQYYNVIKGIL